MRNRAFTAVSLIALILVPQLQIATAAVSTPPIPQAFWNFENGIVLGDSAVGGMHLSTNGNPQYTVIGEGHNGGRALSLDGNSWLSANGVIPNALLGKASYTLAAWFKSSVGGTGGILGYGVINNCGASNNLRFSGDSNFHNYWFWCDYTSDATPTTFANNAWHHVAVTYDGSIRRFYFDGSLLSYEGSPPTCAGTCTLGTPPNFQQGELDVGKTLADFPFAGLLDDVAIFSRSLSISEVINLAANGVTTDSQINFDSNGGGTISLVLFPNGANALATPPANPTRTNYTFMGWSTDGVTPLVSYTVTGSAVLYAVWNLNRPTIASTSISGTARIGQTLTATANSTTGLVSSTSYQWQRSEKINSGFSNISGSNSSAYLLTTKDSERYIRVITTVINTSGSASATSVATSKVLEAKQSESKDSKGEKKESSESGKNN